MCTAISLTGNSHYFGRNLDFEHPFGEKILITPRNFPLNFRYTDSILSHYAIIGMGIVSDGYPLYFDATNEKGLSMAGLLFPGYAYYHANKPGICNIASFELILWMLSQCADVSEARRLLKTASICADNFSPAFPSTPMHWIVADKNECITVESVKEGLFVYDNPVGVLSNSPDFPMQMFFLNNFMTLSPAQPENSFSDKLQLHAYSKGMGAMGLPGDFSSMSRFVRASFVKLNSIEENSEQVSVCHFFHILQSVFQPKGCNLSREKLPQVTHYSSCVNTDKGIYYYKTYNNISLNAVSLYEHNLDAETIYTFDLRKDWSVNFQR